MRIVRDAVAEHFPGRACQLACFNEKGYSYEEWFNWELYYALRMRGHAVDPKYPYLKTPANRVRKQGDLLVNKKALIEVGLVHDLTQNKWLQKLESDRDHLRKASADGYTALQMLVLVSHYSNLVRAKTWKGWLEELSFWKQCPGQYRAWRVAVPLPGEGQLLVLCWFVRNE